VCVRLNHGGTTACFWYCSPTAPGAGRFGPAGGPRPPWLSTPVAMLFCWQPPSHAWGPSIQTTNSIGLCTSLPEAHVQTLIRPPVELGMHITSCEETYSGRRDVGTGPGPLGCWFLADEARRGAFSSGLLLLLLVQAGEGGGGESGAHSYHRPVLVLVPPNSTTGAGAGAGAVHQTLLLARHNTRAKLRVTLYLAPRPHTCCPDDQSRQQFCHNTLWLLRPFIFVASKILS
jgi:hypothetical protein